MPLPSAVTLATLWDKLAGLVIGIGLLEQNLGAQGPQNTLPQPVPSPPGAVFGWAGGCPPGSAQHIFWLIRGSQAFCTRKNQ